MSTENKICEHCGSIGAPCNASKGSSTIEILLWFFGLGCGFVLAMIGILFFIPLIVLSILVVFPAIFYSVWRCFARQELCGYCAKPGMVEMESPRGQELADRYESYNHALEEKRYKQMQEHLKPSTKKEVEEEEKRERKSMLMGLMLLIAIALVIWIPFWNQSVAQIKAFLH